MLPTITEVVQSLRAKFLNDAGLTVIHGRNKEMGQFRISLPTATSHVEVAVPLKVQGRDLSFVLEPAATQTTYAGVYNRQLSAGTLYTLYDCTHGRKLITPLLMHASNI